MTLPALDFSLHTDGDDQQRRKFSQAFLASLQAHGFAKITNHGFDREYVDELMMWCRLFFDLPPTAKFSIQNQRGPKPQRGYSGPGDENFTTFNLDSSHQSYVDMKEHFDVGPANDPSFPNQWPHLPTTPSSPDLTSFRPFIDAYFTRASKLSTTLLSILESALNVAEGTLTRSCDKYHNELRLNHYPPTSIAAIRAGKVRRTGAHTDFGTLTLLFQDGTGGLEIEDRSPSNPSAVASFIPIDADDPYALVVNVGDTLQRWTNDLVPAGLHQVMIPEGRRDEVGELGDRYSVAFFQKANRDVDMGARPAFVSEKRPLKYEGGMKAIEYHERRHAVLYA